MAIGEITFGSTTSRPAAGLMENNKWGLMPEAKIE